jgi:hypothetical protein
MIAGQELVRGLFHLVRGAPPRLPATGFGVRVKSRPIPF